MNLPPLPSLPAPPPEPGPPAAMPAWQPPQAFIQITIGSLLVGSVVAGVGLLLFAPQQTGRPLGAGATGLLALASWWLLGRGRVDLAVTLLCYGLLVVVTGVAVFTGGAGAPVVVVLPMLTLVFSWMTGPRTGWWMAALCILVLAGLLAAEWAGALPRAWGTPSGLAAVVPSTLVVMAWLLASHFMRAYRERLDELQRAGQALARRSRELEFSAAQLRATLDAVPDLMFEMDLDGRYHRFHSQSEEGLVTPLPQLIGRTAAELMPAPAAAACLAALREAHQGGRSRGHQLALPLAQGERWFELSVARKATAPGEPARFIVLSRDITERRQAGVALQASEARLRAIIEATPVPLALHDGQRRLVYLNRAFGETVGYTLDEMPTLEHWWPLAYPDAAYREALTLQWRAHEAEALRRGGVFEPVEAQVRCRDGRTRTFAISATPLQGVDDGARLVVLYDLTEREQVARQLRDQQASLEHQVQTRTAELALALDAAEAASRAKSSFLANMSHEIRTPMNGIQGMAYLMRRDGVSPRQAERLDRIEAAAAQLLSILNDILDISKIEAGMVVLAQVPVAVNGLIGDLGAMLAAAAAAKGLALHTETAALPQRLLGDPTRLQQALMNYASNALKFTEQGSVTLRARVQHETDDAVWLRFEVQDTGIGIAESALPRLFSAFEQADNSPSRKYGGTGLGLAITARLAGLMGGEAGCSSKQGEGSIFWFTARLAKAGPPPPG